MHRYDKSEAKVITYLPKEIVGEDIHLVKEVILNENNEYEDRINIIKDFKRPFYVTKPLYRTHEDKKESEDISKVNKFYSTQSNLEVNVAKRLGIQNINNYLYRTIRKSQYLYGIDVDSRTYLKHIYMAKNDNALSPYRVGVYDIEFDVLKSKLIILGLVTRKVLKIGLLKSYSDTMTDTDNKLREMYDRHIPNVDFKQNMKIEVKVFDNEVDIIRWIFHEANYCEIDILTGWNIKYDITTILDILEFNHVKPEDVFHYDKIPDEYKYFKFIEGKSKKIMESGKASNINIEDRWHIYQMSSNYQMLDAMNAHRYIRVGTATIPGGYSLDNILKFEKISQKLKFDNNTGFKGLEWHIDMVANHPDEYVVYNTWDNMSILALDDKTKDLTISLPLLAGVSHPDIFNSGPKRIVDALTFFYLANNKVLGVREIGGSNEKLLGLSGWIITLQAYLLETSGIDILENMNVFLTTIHSYVYDSDQVSGYPSNTMATNVSKDTTHMEIIDIIDKDKLLFILQNMNLMYGKTNALEYCQRMFDMPTIYENLKKIR